MCDPTMLAIAAIGGGIIAGVGAAKQTEAAAVSEANNAEAADMQAMTTHLAGAYQGARLMDEAARIGGQQRAAIAEGGLEMTGSAYDVMADTASEIQLEHAAILTNSNLSQASLGITKDISLQNSADARASKPFAFLSPVLGAATRIPSGAFGFA